MYPHIKVTVIERESLNFFWVEKETLKSKKNVTAEKVFVAYWEGKYSESALERTDRSILLIGSHHIFNEHLLCGLWASSKWVSG